VPAFSTSLATNTIGFFVMFGTLLLIAQYLQLVLGLSPLVAGLWTIPSSLGFTAGSILTSIVAQRATARAVIAGGAVVAALGFVLLTQADGASGLAVLVSASVIFSVGLAPAYILSTDLIVASAPPERAGAASAISETGTELGGAVGVGVLGSIGTAVYRSAMTDAVPAEMPADAAAVARSTLGGALAVAEQLPLQVGSEMLTAARAAFTQGMVLSAAIAAAAMIAIAVMALMWLPAVRPGSAASH
jgi:DHA2 family multidrug resistance protein-like MFS transporter